MDITGASNGVSMPKREHAMQIWYDMTSCLPLQPPFQTFAVNLTSIWIRPDLKIADDDFRAKAHFQHSALLNILLLLAAGNRTGCGEGLAPLMVAKT